MNNLNSEPDDGVIRLYWWNQIPNFGDGISKIVVEKLSGRPVIWASPSDCDIFAVGSIMKLARRAYSKPNQEKKPWVWGTGSIGPQRRDFVNNVRFALVRGPLTAVLLGLEMENYGDPGLLVANALGEDIERGDYVGLIPHHSQIKSTQVSQISKSDPRLKLIDVRNKDAKSVVREIASCKYVLSSSLHGLIVADSYGIPNTWLRPNGIHSTPKFKFYDYALSVGRVLGPPIGLEDVSSFIDELMETDIEYQEGILTSKMALVNSFPEELKCDHAKFKWTKLANSQDRQAASR